MNITAKEAPIVVANLKAQIFVEEARAKALRQYELNTNCHIQANVHDKAAQLLADTIRSIKQTFNI